MTYKILLCLTIFTQVACGQTNYKSNSKPFSFLDSLITKDSYRLELLDFEYPKDIQEILVKFQKSMAEKKDWFQDYFSKYYKPGEGLPYNENFGVTKEEYQRIKDLEKSPPSVVIKSTTLIKAVRNSEVLTFEVDGNADKFIEALKIDFKNDLLIFINDTIPYSTEINAPISTPFGEWHGFSWKKETSNLGEKDELKIDSLISKIVEVDFGKLKSNNKTLLRIKYKDINKGTVNANIDVACYLN